MLLQYLLLVPAMVMARPPRPPGIPLTITLYSASFGEGSMVKVYGYACVNVDKINIPVKSTRSRIETICYAYREPDCSGMGFKLEHKEKRLGRYMQTASIQCFDTSGAAE